MKPQSPCLHCEGREPKCHTACKRYAAFTKELEAWKQAVRAEKYEGAEADTYRIEFLIQRKRKRGEK